MIDIEKTISDLLKDYTKRDIQLAIDRVSLRAEERTLTVVVNFGMHALPENVMRGDNFYFSEGNLDLSRNGVNATISDLTKRSVKFLRKKVWNKIYIIPSGHPLLVSLCTLIVYRVTRISPVIVYYVDGEYIDAEVDVRKDAVIKNRLS